MIQIMVSSAENLELTIDNRIELTKTTGYYINIY